MLITDSGELVRQVRSALTHLYDIAYLQNHPLASLLADKDRLDDLTSAQQLRRLLLDCIDVLKPQPQDAGSDGDTRAYAILTYRYIDGLSVEEIGARLAISRRQLYREHAKGVAAIASILSNRLLEANKFAGTNVLGSRLEAAQEEVGRLHESSQAECLDLSATLEEVCDLLAPLAHEAGVSLAVTPTSIDCTVIADRTILRQALLNLLTYALDTVQRDEVVLSCRHSDQGFLLHVNESTREECGSRTPGNASGSGLGLTVSQQLIGTQGGQLWASHDDGVWHAQMVLPAPSTKTVLVVDDNAQIVDLIQRYVGAHRVSVVGSTSGSEAIRVATELNPELILLDIMLPTQDGWEILQQLKASAKTKHIPVAICSVLDERRLALSMGACDYVNKPVDQVELLRVLQRWLGILHPVA